MIIKYLFYFIQIKNYHKKLYYQFKRIYFKFIIRIKSMTLTRYKNIFFLLISYISKICFYDKEKITSSMFFLYLKNREKVY
jgi:hypothetical protein